MGKYTTYYIGDQRKYYLKTDLRISFDELIEGYYCISNSRTYGKNSTFKALRIDRINNLDDFEKWFTKYTIGEEHEIEHIYYISFGNTTVTEENVIDLIKENFTEKENT